MSGKGGKRGQRDLLKSKSFKRSRCSLACTLDVIGDKWTLLIIRDLFYGKSRYKEFHESKENIPTNILADRLQHLESSGLVTKVPYQDNPVRYEYRLTDTGRSLGPVLKAITEWAKKELPGTYVPGNK